uniref:Uncharacterized protein n=1 Tax=Glossina austeni TaxID=7395 RepID=A0A1A9VL63_GLOAU
MTPICLRIYEFSASFNYSLRSCNGCLENHMYTKLNQKVVLILRTAKPLSQADQKEIYLIQRDRKRCEVCMLTLTRLCVAAYEMVFAYIMQLDLKDATIYDRLSL